MTVFTLATAEKGKPAKGWAKPAVRRAVIEELKSKPDGLPPLEAIGLLHGYGIQPDHAMLLLHSRWPEKYLHDQKGKAQIDRKVLEFYSTTEDPCGTKLPAWRPTPKSESKMGVAIRSFNDIRQKEVKWLWPERFAIGKVSLIAGFPEQGKSQIALSIAATVSLGGDWPNNEGKARRAGVVIMSSEDDAEDTIKPRLSAYGADMGNIFEVNSMVKVEDGVRVFNIHDDLQALTNEMIRLRASGIRVELIILDPINAYFGGRSKVDSHNSSEMRAILTPIKEWATKMGVAVIGISHFNKGGAGNSTALHRITDSQAITAAARSVYLCLQESDSNRRLFVPAKKSNSKQAQGIAYKMVDAFVDSEAKAGKQITMPKIEWLEAVDKTAEQLMAAPKRERASLTDAKEFLNNFLANGPQLKATVLKAAHDDGHRSDTLLRAKRELGVVSDKEGFQGPARWSLAGDTDEAVREFEDTDTTEDEPTQFDFG